MHEFSIATQILESVLEFAEAHPDKVVSKVKLEIGELMCIEPEQLRFCYDSIKGDTPLKNSLLEIQQAAAIVKCRHCKFEGPPKYWSGVLRSGSIRTLQCPECGKAAEAVQGQDCVIKTVQLQDFNTTDAVVPATHNHSENHDECDPNTSAIPSEA